ncbi:MAG: hypothetical protein K2N44_05275 [Lachnospiraceae bacterium]|nr:hypothetical protein [Lachnospiraceae bacterium]
MSMDSYYKRNPVLLYIGKRIVEDVLDKTNEEYISAIASPEADVLEKKLESFSQDQLHILQELIPWITMGTVSNMLWLFEQNEDIQLIVEYEGKRINIAETSDGLDDEFCGEEGWIDRFGKYLDFMTIETRRICNSEREES